MCNDILPNTWKHPISVAFPMIACFPVYAEKCPKCGYSLVEGRPPLTEAEILEDKRKQKKENGRDLWNRRTCDVYLFFDHSCAG